MNPEQFPTYKVLSPVLKTQTTVLVVTEDERTSIALMVYKWNPKIMIQSDYLGNAGIDIDCAILIPIKNT